MPTRPNADLGERVCGKAVAYRAGSVVVGSEAGFAWFYDPIQARRQVSLEEALREALHEARRGAALGELPYGAVILGRQGRIVARAHDQVEHDGDLTSHAELLAVRRAARAQGPELSGHRLVCTVEPCAMCFSSAWTARLSGVAFGLSMSELKATRPAALDEVVVAPAALNALSERRLEIVSGVLRSECLALWD